MVVATFAIRDFHLIHSVVGIGIGYWRDNGEVVLHDIRYPGQGHNDTRPGHGWPATDKVGVRSQRLAYVPITHFIVLAGVPTHSVPGHIPRFRCNT